jgi:lysyl-tRNA synthetase class 2
VLRIESGGSMSRRFASWRRGIAAVAAGAAGLTTIAGQALSNPIVPSRHHASAFSLVPLHALGIAGGLGLLVLAVGLWRGKRRAADVAVVALCGIAVVRLAYGLGLLDSGIELAAAALVFLNRDAFPRGACRVRSPRAAGDTLMLIAAAALYGAYAVAIIGEAHGTEVDQLITAAGRDLPGWAAWMRHGTWMELILSALVAIIVVSGWAVLRALLRPSSAEDGHPPEEHRKAQAILREHGRDSLDPFTLREDKALHFAAGGYLAYRVLSDTAVVSGDPVGPPGSAGTILASFNRFADERGWNVVITGASDRHLDACQSLGLRVLKIGEEAVVDPRRFSLEGRPIRKVRQSIARVDRRGWRVQVVRDGDVTAGLSEELASVEAEWRSSQRRLIGFAMTFGRLVGTDEGQDGIYVLARDPEGRLRSFLRFASYRDGLSLDLMRRSGDEPNGLTEAQVVAAIEHAREAGMTRVSLNFAGFAHVMAADAVLSRSQRLLRSVLRLLHGRFQLERLVRFNAKFFPEWRSRYLVYGGLPYLPLSALRVMQAEAYLPAPGARRARRLLMRPAAAGAICAALTAPSLFISGIVATAQPLHIRADLRHRSWSFVYRGSNGPMKEQSLYLPKDTPVVVRIVRLPSHRPDYRRATEASRRVARTIRVDATHRGDLSLPCNPALSADVLGPKAFHERMETSSTSSSPGSPSPSGPSRSPSSGGTATPTNPAT